MNRGILGLIGAAALLSSCNVTVTTPADNSSTTLSLDAISSYTSQYKLLTSTQDQNGNTLAAGTPIICDNLNTRLDVGVSWTGGLQQIGIRFKGALTGTTTNTSVFGDRYSTPDYSGNGTASITIRPGLAPLKVSSGISAQAIVVTPINTVNVKGYTYVQAFGKDSNGNYSNVVQSVTDIPVADCS
ncbi:hypothetical protein [Deinococcus alpinitundrae]|uniref:hypothetical protein n=1 Tax=Deinococcus alpinitundrae TaxID=468913 RepID=UPI00137B1DD5|nr:hypothetical protein [Deinococcus alpinitundrae]